MVGNKNTKAEIERMGAEYSEIYDAFQKLNPKVDGWKDIGKRTERKWDMILMQKQLLTLAEQTKIMKLHSEEMTRYTDSFVNLTWVLIIATIVNALIVAYAQWPG